MQALASRRSLEKHGWVRVSQDVLKTRPRCITAATSALGDGRSVIIDRVNFDQEQVGPDSPSVLFV